MNNQTLQQTRHADVQQTTARNRDVVYTPEVDIVETPESYVLDVYMPGVNEKSAEATLENDVLSIRGQVELPANENAKLVHQEYGIGDYRRVFTLSEGIDREHVSASVRDGVLHVVLPKAERSKAKRIAITTA